MNKKPLTEAEKVEIILNWIDEQYEETHSEIILKSEKRNYVIVPHARKNFES